MYNRVNKRYIQQLRKKLFLKYSAVDQLIALFIRQHCVSGILRKECIGYGKEF